MTVREAIEELQDLHRRGYSSHELIAVDTRSGVSSSLGIGTPKEKTIGDCAGTLCEWKDGEEYVPVYLDH
jgi:hypothetical protein